jgi:glycosyltransferase involved in cell wall biosynthesis/predicted Zn-dependent protease
MALRLTDPSRSPTPSRPTPAQLCEHAAAFLRAGDRIAYRALFDDAAALENRHDRYGLRRALVERGLAAAGAEGAAAAAIYLSVAEALLDLLEEEPREPVLLNYAGVALYELGALKAAKALFEAAGRLDPSLPHVAQNVKEIARRVRSGARLERLPGPVSVAVPAAAQRALRCASSARPAEGLTLSLCMIVKDEEEMLPRCLEAVAPAVDEIVVVDTGSTDRTVEVAESFGARVIHVEWKGDFASARNVSFEAATGDWLMYLDADEVLVREDAARLRALTGRVWREAFYLVETNFTGELENRTTITHNALRVFRNRPEYRFEGRIHEQVAHHLPRSLPERMEATQVRVEHYGYLGVVRDAKDKSRRNLELLERQAAEGDDSPFLHYNLGSEYGALADVDKALHHLTLAWEAMKGGSDLHHSPFVFPLVYRRVRALRLAERLEEADAAAREGLELFPGFTDLVFERALAAYDGHDLTRAAVLLEKCIEMGDGPSRYTSIAGYGSYVALMQLAQVRRERAEHEEAEELLTTCLRDYPAFITAAGSLAETMLERQAEPAEVLEAVEDAVSSLTPSVRFLVGVALYEAGFAEEAAAQFRLVLDRQPSSEPARVALGEALLSRRRYEEAAAVVSEGRDEDRSAAGCRTELFGRIASGDMARAAAALERARSVGLSHADVAFFSAWMRVTTDPGAVGMLPAESAGILLTTLEALLRVEEFDHFGRLVPFVEKVGIPWRERRQMLAMMYLRRGFLESAADEWVSVCERTGPDVPALLGLAQLAFARGMDEEAVLLAREIRALDPGHPAAARILGVLDRSAP